MGPTRKENVMKGKVAKFQVGELIHHRRFNYRGVVIDVDAGFSGTEEWYNTMAHTNPPKDEPWYHVLVHKAEHTTYVAERNLESDLTGKPVFHPVLDHFFGEIKDGVYVRRQAIH